MRKWEIPLAERESELLMAWGDGGFRMNDDGTLSQYAWYADITVVGYLDGKGHVVIECPYCDCFHYHGDEGGRLSFGDKTSRSKHCLSQMVGWNVAGYDIVISGEPLPWTIRQMEDRDEKITRRYWHREYQAESAGVS